MKNAEKKLNIDYASLHAVYWTLSGVIFCFTTVFLQFKGYSNYGIGIIFALGNILGFVLQPLVAGYVDRSNKRALLGCIRITAVLSLLLMLVVLMLPKSCLPLTAAYVVLLAGNTLLQPLCISLSFYLESWGYRINFSVARCGLPCLLAVHRGARNARPVGQRKCGSCRIHRVFLYTRASYPAVFRKGEAAQHGIGYFRRR